MALEEVPGLMVPALVVEPATQGVVLGELTEVAEVEVGLDEVAGTTGTRSVGAVFWQLSSRRSVRWAKTH